MVDDTKHCREAWQNAGLAVELALKAVIMRRRRYNAWPSREAARELYTHCLRSLAREADIDLMAVPPRIRVSFRVALDWRRGHDYVARPMPRPVARDMVNAAFGEEGVVEWLKQLN